MEVAPYRLSGRVYGTLMNHRSALQVLGDAVTAPPYKAAPQAPVLYIKPRNTLSGPVVVPPETGELEVGACLGVVIGRTACDEQQDCGRQKLHQADHAEIEGAPGKIVNLPADRHRRDLAGEAR